MRPRLFLYAATAVVLGAGAGRAQQPLAPAELFPAKVLAYAEVRQPGRQRRAVEAQRRAEEERRRALDKLKEKPDKESK
jgi:hypothetical protein